MPDFFKDLSGTVHLTSASRNLVEEMAHWGDLRSSAAQFGPEDRWALRRGQERLSGPGLLSPRCSHIDDGPEPEDMSARRWLRKVRRLVSCTCANRRRRQSRNGYLTGTRYCVA